MWAFVAGHSLSHWTKPWFWWQRRSWDPQWVAAGGACYSSITEMGIESQGSFKFSVWIWVKANWVASSFEENTNPQHPTVRMGNRQAEAKGKLVLLQVWKAKQMRGSVLFLSLSHLSPAPFPICSVSSAPFPQPGRAEPEELISSRCVCVRPHPKMPNHRLPLDSWQQLSLLKNTKLTRLPNKPKHRSFISGRKR